MAQPVLHVTHQRLFYIFRNRQVFGIFYYLSTMGFGKYGFFCNYQPVFFLAGIFQEFAYNTLGSLPFYVNNFAGL